MLLFVVVACKEENSKANLNELTNGAFLTANIDGVDYSFSNQVNVNSTSEFSHIINGYNKELKTRITLGVNLDKQTTGTFDLSNNIILVYHTKIMLHEKKTYYNWSAKKSVLGSSGKIQALI